jgi:stage II sporulation protein D
LQRNYLQTHRLRHAPEADLCDNTHCQLFHGDGISARARELVRRALAIELRESDARPCYYSANCGGSTLTPSQVWRRHEAGYASVRCDGCRNSRWHRWRREVPISDVSRRVFADAPTPPFVDDDFKLRAGRVLGFNTLPSNTVDRIERRRTHFVVSGRGFGHRIGLCQDGARDEARRGRRAAEILRRYFPTATVTTSPR